MNIKTSRKKLEKDFQSLVKDVRSLLKSSANDASDEAKDLRERLEGRMESLQSNLAEKYHYAEDRFEDGLESTDELVKGNPYYAMGITFGFGLLLGLMLRRR